MMKKILLLALAAMVFAACSDEGADAPVAASGIKLNRDKAEMWLGETLQLEATITPADAADPIVWSSEDETIATVSETGLVEAVASGPTVITARCGKVSASCSVQVSQKPIPATGIELDREKAEMWLGETLQLKATVAPVDTTDPIVWSSDDETVVTVSETGLVEAVSLGTAVVTARCGEFSATCTVRGDQLISFETVEKMMGVDGKAVTLGTATVVSGKNKADFPNVYWAKEYTEANDMRDDYDQLFFASPLFSTADGNTWFSSYYCDCTLYGAQYDAWGGFILSSNVNKTVSSSQAGQDNQFEAYADGGADGSEIFAVCYDAKSAGLAMSADCCWPQIDFTDGACEAISVALANSTWTYNYFSGKQGDSYAIKITGKLNDTEVGSVVCPLIEGAEKADTWKTFDLSSLGKVDRLVFTVVSSQPYAPFYFCLDNLILQK